MKKIMFNDRFLLTQAVLDGRKTQTRRIINPQTYYDENVGMVWKGRFNGRGVHDSQEPHASYRNFIHNSRYKVDEIVAVAQSYYDAKVVGDTTVGWPCVFDDGDAGYTNKMFVKASLMPHQIRITNVRVQCLQDITEDDCLQEGIETEECTDGGNNYIFFDAKRDLYIRERTPRDAYARLINAISGKGTWESNPFVFAYDFERV